MLASEQLRKRVSDFLTMGNQTSLIGTILQNRYRLIRAIGEGGMGVVYEGEHLTVERRVAIKLLHPEFAQKPDIVKRFQREARAAAYTGNEHVVEVLDMDALPDGSPFMVLEYLDGINLDQLVESNGPLELGRAVRIVIQVCDALDAVHEAGIIHRDLKPDNIYLVPRGANPDFVKVLDFGISKFKSASFGQTATLTTTGSLIGTPSFMAPEQIDDGHDVDRRADIFALGGILYYALTANIPFTAETLYLLWVKICNEPSPSVTRLRPDIPIEIDDVISRALEKEPGKRFASCAELKAALWPYLDQSPELISIAPRAHTYPPGRRRLVPVLLGSIGISVAIATISFQLGHRPRHEQLPTPHQAQVEAKKATSTTDSPPVPNLETNRLTVATVPVMIKAVPERAKLYLDDQPINNPFNAELPLSKNIRKVKAVLDGRTRTGDFIPDRRVVVRLDFAHPRDRQTEKRRPVERQVTKGLKNVEKNANGSDARTARSELGSDRYSDLMVQPIETHSESLPVPRSRSATDDQLNTQLQSEERTQRDTHVAPKKRRLIQIREE